jgi:hypothetical protein
VTPQVPHGYPRVLAGRGDSANRQETSLYYYYYVWVGVGYVWVNVWVNVS